MLLSVPVLVQHHLGRRGRKEFSRRAFLRLNYRLPPRRAGAFEAGVRYAPHARSSWFLEQVWFMGTAHPLRVFLGKFKSD